VSPISNKIENPSPERLTSHRMRRHLRRRKSKKTILKLLSRWIRDNPLKLVAIFCLGVLIYITALFILNSKEVKSVKGIPEMRKTTAAP
jgi:hypothetical protein